MLLFLCFDLVFLVQGSGGDLSFQSSSDNPISSNTQQLLPSDTFSEVEVVELVSLGFSRDQVISELRRFNGDKTQATAALFAKSLKF